MVDQKLRATLQALAESRTKWPLYLYGLAGVGKTLGALCLADITRTAAYLTVDGACDLVIGGGGPSLWQRVGQKDLAILDELGTRQIVGDLHYSVVKGFADARTIDGRGVAVYVSNVAPNKLAEMYDDRIASRLLCGTWFELKGSDRRMSQ